MSLARNLANLLNSSGLVPLPSKVAGVLPDANAPSGSVIQVATTTLQGVVTTTANGVPNTITNGVQVFSQSFTPTSASSTILVLTSSIAISEESNMADMCWLALWNGSNFVAANSATWLHSHFNNGYNGAYTSINEAFAAGDTSTRTIQVRAGINGGASAAYVNGASTYNYSGTSAQVRMTILEIAG